MNDQRTVAMNKCRATGNTESLSATHKQPRTPGIEGWQRAINTQSPSLAPVTQDWEWQAING